MAARRMRGSAPTSAFPFSLNELQFVPATVELRDRATCFFQLGFEFEHFLARFRVKIWRREYGFQSGHFLFSGQDVRFHRLPFALFLVFQFSRRLWSLSLL